MCSFTLQHRNQLLLSWLSSDRGEKNEPRSNLPAIITRTTSFSWAVCFKARGCSRLHFPHFLQTFYQSGSLAESYRIWPVSLRVTTTGRLSACERLPFLSLVPPLSSPRAGISPASPAAFTILHLDRGSWQAEHVFSEAFVDLKKKSPTWGLTVGFFSLDSHNVIVCVCVCACEEYKEIRRVKKKKSPNRWVQTQNNNSRRRRGTDYS